MSPPRLDPAAVSALFGRRGTWAKMCGRRVQARRLKLGLTANDLAHLCGSQLNTIHRIESGAIVPRDRLRALIGYALDCNPQTLWAYPSEAELEDVAAGDVTTS